MRASGLQIRKTEKVPVLQNTGPGDGRWLARKLARTLWVRAEVNF